MRCTAQFSAEQDRYNTSSVPPVAGHLLLKEKAFLLTVAAQTGEGQSAAFDVAAATFFPVVPGHGDLVQVDDRIAIAADEVDMGFGVGVEAFHTFHRGHTHDGAFGLEFRQIPVNRRQRDVGMFLMQHFVHHIRGGMGVGVLQAGKDRVALFELLRDFSIGTSCSRFICD